MEASWRARWNAAAAAGLRGGTEQGRIYRATRVCVPTRYPSASAPASAPAAAGLLLHFLSPAIPAKLTYIFHPLAPNPHYDLSYGWSFLSLCVLCPMPVAPPPSPASACVTRSTCPKSLAPLSVHGVAAVTRSTMRVILSTHAAPAGSYHPYHPSLRPPLPFSLLSLVPCPLPFFHSVSDTLHYAEVPRFFLSVIDLFVSSSNSHSFSYFVSPF